MSEHPRPRRPAVALAFWLATSFAILPHPSAAQPPASATARPGGEHDFDFDVGVWNAHIRRRLHPLSDSSEVIDLKAVITVRKVWDGRAALEEIEADGPSGHWEAMSLLLYNPKARQWTQNYFNSATIDPDNHPLTGSFAHGRGELYATDTLNGRPILVRGVYSDITPNSHRYEESYSGDGGRTWETAFTSELTRAPA